MKIARSCHSEDVSEIDPGSLLMLCILGAVASSERSGLFLLCIRTCRLSPPPETKLVLTGTGILAYMHPLDKKVRCVACYSEGGAWRRSIGRRLVFSFLSRGCSQDARAQRVGKDDDQKVKIHKRYGWYKLNITHIWLICTRSVLFVTTGYRTWLLPWTLFFLELPGTAVSRIV